MATKKTKQENPFKAATDKSKQQQDAIVNDGPVSDPQSPEPKPKGVTPKQAETESETKVGLNLRITKDRRAFIKSWCALHDVAMNDLVSDIIDQIKDERYNPLNT